MTEVKTKSHSTLRNEDKSIQVSPSKINKEYLINENCAICYVIRNWLDKVKADELYAKYIKEAKFEQYKIEMYGKIIPQPRFQLAVGDETVSNHRYSGTSIPIHPWLPEVKEIADRIMAETGTKINSCLLNYYVDGSHYIGYHSDRETKKEFNNIVITVSLGGTRRFYFQRKSDKKIIKTELHSGDLVIMKGRTQELYKHTIPKQAKAQARISLTYRYLT